MINVDDHIRLTNVISKQYYFHYSEFENATKDFMNSVIKLNADMNGLVFYSLNNVPKDENVLVEFFVTVKQDYVDVPEDMNFYSYYNIENMISTTIKGNFNQNSEYSYALLIEYMKQNNLKQITPFFNIVSGDDTFQYVFLKVGVALLE